MSLDSSEPGVFHMLVSREEWGASLAKTLPRLTHPVLKVRYTHTNTDECSSESECLMAVREIQRNHMKTGFADIKHNFLVGGDGRVYEGRGWNFQSDFPLYFIPDGKGLDLEAQILQQKYQGRGLHIGSETTKNSENNNNRAVDFAFIGKYMGDKNVSQHMIDVARGLVDWGIRRKMFHLPFEVEEYYDEI